jgi:hypothetical protein
VITCSQEAFRELSIAGVPVLVVRTMSEGTRSNPGGFALVIADAHAAQMLPDGDHKNGCVSLPAQGKQRTFSECSRRPKNLQMPPIAILVTKAGQRRDIYPATRKRRGARPIILSLPALSHTLWRSVGDQ